MLDIVCNNATSSGNFNCTASQSANIMFSPSPEFSIAITIFFLIIITMSGIYLGLTYIKR